MLLLDLANCNRLPDNLFYEFEPQPATVWAKTKVTTRSIHRRPIRQLMKSDPQLSTLLYRNVMSMVREKLISIQQAHRQTARQPTTRLSAAARPQPQYAHHHRDYRQKRRHQVIEPVPTQHPL
jgi:CRP-like cAMP-binding protein